ncbi:hypothetical protein [Dysgonomonas sp. ZJ709]|uniref:hypothetical protein n=1 Tax=Dysgonomonas sp. ZJ709 TaxID=2709797 RepID=UPI0013EE243E|nr:hypothetical protein [Dysgonomonas sp. ZJ709]
MRIKIFLLLMYLLSSSSILKSQEITPPDSIFGQAYNYINGMLNDDIPLSFKDAVFSTETAYYGRTLNLEALNEEYSLLLNLVENISNSNLITYTGKDAGAVTKYAAIFKVLTDTVLVPVNSTLVYEHTPYTYDFDDPLGQRDWSKMFICNLLETGKGNCHSLPYLYKILAEELNVPCNLAFAPNHIYIKLFSETTGWYNTELTSATFPIDAWLMASGYITIDAIRNGLYMDTLSNKQAVANCLIDLAHGYQHKYGKENPEFVIQCCNTALEYHPANINALLTKAEAQKFYIHSLMKAKNLKKPEQLFADQTIKDMYSEMESIYIELHKSGYRRMPEEMYSKWIDLLRTESKTYTNKKMKTI